MSNSSNFSGHFLTGTTPSTALTITFNSVASGVDFYVGDIDASEVLAIEARNSQGGLLESLTLHSGDAGTGDGFATHVILTSTGISSITLSPNFAGWGMDNLTYSDSSEVGTAPEPSTFAFGALAVAALVAGRKRDLLRRN